MENFFTCYLMGGIGNQMFQVAHTIAEGLKYNKNCVFRKNSYTPMQGRDTSNYINNIFRNIKFEDNVNFDLRINEKDWSYGELEIPENKSVEFYGYFQSSKNFNGFNDEIKNLFLPTDLFVKESMLKFPELNQENTLSIHIRRGDCFQNPDIHPMPTVQYVKKCLDIIGEYSHIFMFTDDKVWVKENLKFENCTYIDDEDYNEIWLMSLCKNNIMSNSTFSWWGSFLNKNKDKKVIAPSVWFGPRGPQNYKDIYEDNWTIVDVKYNNGFFE